MKKLFSFFTGGGKENEKKETKTESEEREEDSCEDDSSQSDSEDDNDNTESEVKPGTKEPNLEALDDPSEIIENCYIKLSGLPWKSTENEIAKFLVDCNIVGNVVIIQNEHGKPSGDAVVKLIGKSDLEKALKCHKKYLHERFIEIEEIKGDTYIKHMEMEKTQKTAFSKLSGLVWTATEKDIKTFLHDCKIREVVITTNERGKPSGNAFVHFESKADTEKAKAHNRENLRERFVIVEEIEEQEYIKETERDHKSNQPSKDSSSSHVKLSGLPRSSSESDIQAFLKNCSIKIIMIMRNSDGEAIVEVESSDDQARALICHNSTLGGNRITVNKLEKIEVSKLDEVIEQTTREQKRAKVERKEEKQNTFKFCVKLKAAVDEDDALEECKEIVIDGVTWGYGNLITSVDKKSEIELECTVRDEIESGVIQKEIEKLIDFVEHVVIIGGKNHENSFDQQKMTFKFVIKPWDNISDEREVLEDCKDVELDGVIWDKGELIPVSSCKSKIQIGCTVEGSDTNAEAIKKELEKLNTVEDVKIIQ